jgi:hypothetical protein
MQNLNYLSIAESTPLPLEYWLDVLRPSDATDPRDKVCAALGLVEKSNSKPNFPIYDPSSLIVDYAASVQDVYYNLVQSLLIAHNHFEILCCSINRSQHVQRTWTPDWTIKRDNASKRGFYPK